MTGLFGRRFAQFWAGCKTGPWQTASTVLGCISRIPSRQAAGLGVKIGAEWQGGHGIAACFLYIDHFKVRKSLGSTTRKLSLTESRNSDHRIGTVYLRNSRTSSANFLYFEWHLLWVMYLCMTPLNRSIGFRCGQ